MKFHFEPDLDYQRDAIASVVDLFKGQESCQTEFTVLVPSNRDESAPELGLNVSLPGYGNRLKLLEEEILENLQAVQLRNGLRPEEALYGMDFTVEMETGTGKTYVYLRTIFKLNKEYGFTKFVIVVPSVAIKEGVHKSLQMMEEHFKAQFAGTTADFFVYDSSKLNQVRSFATSSRIQIMVMTVGAINKKDVNVIYDQREQTNDERPIDLIRATRPIVIVDEPQSVDGGLGGSGKKALEEMAPLCTLRYSATHIDKHHMVYRLDAVDAYERKLVKQIEVAAMEVADAHNAAYVKLLSAKKVRSNYVVELELDRQLVTGIKRDRFKNITADEDLEQLTGRAMYAGYLISNIGVAKGKEFVEFQNLEKPLRIGESVGDVDRAAVHRQMIRRTITEHLDKEQRLRPMGIKVLSLFFIDEVPSYRAYNEDGVAVKGKFATIFEEEYRAAAKLAKYRTLFEGVDLATAPEDVHDGYFSIDKRIHTPFEDQQLKKSSSKEDVETSTFNLIMRDKERLLSFDTPLKFIFSHSALKEGWDNPNVFQICVLREMGSELQRRQTIGRGLRICVNSNTGERVRGFDVNTLTVVANESYERFAEELQHEIEKETGLRFGIVEPHQFAGLGKKTEDGKHVVLGVESSERIWAYLKQQAYIDSKGKVQDSLREVLKNNTLTLPEDYEEQLPAVKEVLRKLAGKLDIKNAQDKKIIRTREAQLHSEEFKALWNRIKQKTTYRVHFNEERLIEQCIKAVNDLEPIRAPRMTTRKADVVLGRSGVQATENTVSAPQVLYELQPIKPDILTELQDRTQLTRASLVRILTECDRLDEFSKNPQQFIDLVAEGINRCKRMELVDGIKYRKLGDMECYAQELFETEELTGYLNMVACDRSVHEYVVYDSSTERLFAQQLDKNEAVKVFAKLPSWFKVPTPLGPYNPDWAVVVEVDGQDRVYFVAETKSSLWSGDLRDKEGGKIKCGDAHFEELASGTENPARFEKVTDVEDLMTRL
ncbi:MAG: DEAD/DEAH box helicase family protein [Flavobacteriales bacterium]|nr:DEAD/DEAH box helicase family protein [Flavobacteriales bacterium]